MLCLERKCSLLEVELNPGVTNNLEYYNINWLFTMECSFVKMVACCLSFLLENVPK